MTFLIDLSLFWALSFEITLHFVSMEKLPKDIQPQNCFCAAQKKENNTTVKQHGGE